MCLPVTLRERAPSCATIFIGPARICVARCDGREITALIGAIRMRKGAEYVLRAALQWVEQTWLRRCAAIVEQIITDIHVDTLVGS